MSDPRTYVIEEVTELPVLNQEEFPDLPTWDHEQYLLLTFSTKLNNSEKEKILAVFLNIAAQSGGFQPVFADDFKQMLWKVLVLRFEYQTVINAAFLLSLEGLMSIVAFQGKHYLIPTPELIEMVNPDYLRIKPIPEPEEE